MALDDNDGRTYSVDPVQLARYDARQYCPLIPIHD
jgi:hypothetical protein